ncbi:unnamed protein product [Nezara viridula]|uniref:Uncharacterized protein n=1 Tax=Nezara viridula TaxID=85310 RepID=A0A9P0E551_NEZVI|nr:unnamed protein product [Nezara viridula]
MFMNSFFKSCDICTLHHSVKGTSMSKAVGTPSVIGGSKDPVNFL